MQIILERVADQPLKKFQPIEKDYQSSAISQRNSYQSQDGEIKIVDQNEQDSENRFSEVGPKIDQNKEYDF